MEKQSTMMSKLKCKSELKFDYEVNSVKFKEDRQGELYQIYLTNNTMINKNYSKF